MELLLLGDTIDAKEAQRIGLVARVFPAAEFAASARAIAEQVARAPRGIGLIKRAVNHANLPNVESDLGIRSAFARNRRPKLRLRRGREGVLRKANAGVYREIKSASGGPSAQGET